VSDDFISGLRSDLLEAAARERARSPVGRAARPLRPRAWSRPVLVGAVALAAAAAAFVATVLALAPTRPTEPARPRIVGTIDTRIEPRYASYAGGRLWIAGTDGQVVAVEVGARRVGMRFAVGAPPTALIAANGEVWARVEAHGRVPMDRVLRIDPATGRTTARVTVDRGLGLAVTERSVWAPRGPASPVAGIERIDRDRAVVAGRTRSVSGVVGVVSADGLLWASTNNPSLVEVDAATGRVITRFGVAPLALTAMVAADRGLWLLYATRSEILRFAGHRLVDRIPVGGGALPLLARTAGGLWTATADAPVGGPDRTRLVRIDSVSHRVTGTVSLGRQNVTALVGAGRDLLVITDAGRVIVVRG
jgi:hypothetical protein